MLRMALLYTLLLGSTLVFVYLQCTDCTGHILAETVKSYADALSSHFAAFTSLTVTTAPVFEVIYIYILVWTRAYTCTGYWGLDFLGLKFCGIRVSSYYHALL